MASKNGRAERITTARACRGNLSRFLDDYDQQPELTARLDSLGDATFTKELINDIVLWKVNRYVSLTPELLRKVGQLRRLKPNEHRKAEAVLTALLKCHGVDLAMASTILRFRNPAVFQIVDRHAYRAIYGTDYPLSTKSTTDRKVSLYFDYVDALVDLCAAKGSAFDTIDRVLYVFDKQKNPKLNL
jgi:thermostable 8-oxoguanine DNA glycosylase